jgi:hypothetical protein
LYPPLEFPTLHTSSLGQFCPIVKRRGQSGCPAAFDCMLCSSGVPTFLRVGDKSPGDGYPQNADDPSPEAPNSAISQLPGAKPLVRASSHPP